MEGFREHSHNVETVRGENLHRRHGVVRGSREYSTSPDGGQGRTDLGDVPPSLRDTREGSHERPMTWKGSSSGLV